MSGKQQDAISGLVAEDESVEVILKEIVDKVVEKDETESVEAVLDKIISEVVEKEEAEVVEKVDDSFIHRDVENVVNDLVDEVEILHEEFLQMGGQDTIVEEIQGPRLKKGFREFLESRYFKVQFSRRISTAPDAGERYAEKLIQMAHEFAPRKLLSVGLVMESDEIEQPVGFRSQPLDQLHADEFMEQMENMDQSGRSPLGVKKYVFNVRINYTLVPSGSGKRTLGTSDYMSIDFDRKKSRQVEEIEDEEEERAPRRKRQNRGMILGQCEVDDEEDDEEEDFEENEDDRAFLDDDSEFPALNYNSVDMNQAVPDSDEDEQLIRKNSKKRKIVESDDDEENFEEKEDDSPFPTLNYNSVDMNQAVPDSDEDEQLIRKNSKKRKTVESDDDDETEEAPTNTPALVTSDQLFQRAYNMIDEIRRMSDDEESVQDEEIDDEEGEVVVDEEEEEELCSPSTSRVDEDDDDDELVDVRTTAWKTKSVKSNGNVMLNDVPRDCLPYALQQGYKFLEYKNKLITRKVYRKVLMKNKISNKNLKDEVKIRKNEVGITKSKDFTLDDVEKFQNGPFFKNWQIVVYSETSDRPIYAGAFISLQKQIILLLKDNHYQAVRNLGSLMRSRYVCPFCFKKSSDSTTHYKCSGKHDKCGKSVLECVVTTEDVPMSCLHCRFTFRSEICFDNHLMKGSRGGKSKCEQRECCPKCQAVFGKNKGNKHNCNKKYCPICRGIRPLEHHCTMPISKRNEKAIKKLRLYFDVESTVDKNGFQKPVLFIGINSCQQCGNRVPKTLEEALEDQCDCSPEGRLKVIECITEVNRDVNVRAEMFKYIFRRENKGYVAVAHNMSSYDGQFLLEEIVGGEVGQPQKLVFEGTKLTFMKFNGVRLMDSLKYVLTSLRKLGETFNIETKKGDFPVNFIKENNFGYNGPYPEIQHYNIEDKSVEEGQRISSFVEEQREKGENFNFNEELLAYCYADVKILAEAFHKFEIEFENLTNVTILEESCTAASAAMKVFQRNHLRENRPIHLDQTASVAGGFSLMSQKYLAYREMLDGKPIERRVTDGEKKIDGYKIDGFIAPCSEYPKGKAIEFNGCFFHAHTCKYTAEQVIFKGSPPTRARHIWERDRKKIEHLREVLSEVEVVWECEMKEEMMENESMAVFINTYEVPESLNISDALTGGRTEVFKLRAIATNRRKIHYKDVVSLYPWVMKHCAFPLGIPFSICCELIEVPITKREQIDFDGFLSVTVLPPKRLRLPLLPAKIDGKLFFALCPVCVSERHQTSTWNCQHSDEERSFDGTYTSMELKKAVELGYVITKVKSAISYPEFVQWHCYREGDVIDYGLFGSYIDTMLKAKIYATGWPNGVLTDEEKEVYLSEYESKEGIYLDKNLFEKNPGRRAAAKMMLNSLWGKMAQRLNMIRTSILTEPASFWKLVQDLSNEIIDILVIDNKGLIVKHRKKAECVNILSTSAMHIAAFTTSHARLKLYSLMEKVGHSDIVYTDTDSLVYYVVDGKDPLESDMGEFLGQLTNELKGDMLEFVSLGPKTYAYKEKLANGKIKTVRKTKGIRGSKAVDDVIGFREMSLMVDEVLEGATERTEIEVEQFNMKRNKLHQVTAGYQKKKFRYTFEKRRVMQGGATVPFGLSL